MASNRIKHATACLLWLAAACLAQAGVIQRASTFAKGQRLAAESGAPHVVLVHGSPWLPLGTRMLNVLWNAPGLTDSLSTPAVLTAIAIPHDPSEEESKAFAQNHAGWNEKSYSTLPALQIHSPDGTLLMTRQGRALRDLATPAEFTAFLHQTLAATTTRQNLLAAIADAEARKDPDAALAHFDPLLSLPFTPDPQTLETLKRLDPSDRLGWQARLEFKPWDTHLREITARIREGKAAEIIEEMDRRLAAGSATPPQQALLLGGKAMALASLDQIPAAADCFQKALAAAPDDPIALAIHRHGLRIAGSAMNEPNAQP